MSRFGGILFAFCMGVRQRIIKTVAAVGRARRYVLPGVACRFRLVAESGLQVQEQHAPPALTAGQKQTVKAFEKRVKEYVSLRERLEAKHLPGHSRRMPSRKKSKHTKKLLKK